jgi:hypothetical protein
MGAARLNIGTVSWAAAPSALTGHHTEAQMTRHRSRERARKRSARLDAVVRVSGVTGPKSDDLHPAVRRLLSELDQLLSALERASSAVPASPKNERERYIHILSGARSKRTGKPCRGAAMPNGRCKVHGGKSTGPRTPEGLERSRRANWKHGHFSREAKAERSHLRAAILALVDLCDSI